MSSTPPFSAPGPAWHLFVPKLFTILRQGYSLDWFRHDLISGLTVAIVALPLAMALAIASGATPDKGLLTAVMAGFLISALGGSRFQIGGPTGAFVVVVFNVIREHGYDGLIIATLMAGAMLIVAGIARMGTWIKYIPEPVVTGFTSGIAVIIFTSQIQDLFGLTIHGLPADFFGKWPIFWAARGTINPINPLIAGGSLALIILLRRFAPRIPGFLVAIVFGAAATTAFGLHIDTIGSRFGGLNGSIPMPHFPDITLARVSELLPSAFTIAFLAGVESLLSAVVADGMTGRRHRSNCELVAQGIANTVSALFGGLPATGAIARTATNIRSGARSPVSGMLHAAFVLLFMLALAPLADYIPLASLAAVLVVVAWNMSELNRFRHLMHAPWGDRIVLLLTFGLTVAVDLTFAIEVGIVLAAVLFMHRMAEVVRGSMGTVIEADIDDFARPTDDVYTQRADLPPDVEVFQFRGPMFFGVAELLSEVLDRIAGAPRVFILRMSQVQMMDATGASRLRDFIDGCRRRGTTLILSGLQPQPHGVLERMHILQARDVRVARTYAGAVAMARGNLDAESASYETYAATPRSPP
jgi:sulfate permease, SulP family